MVVFSREERIERAFNRKHTIHFNPVPQARHRIVGLNRSRMHLYDPSSRDKLFLKAEVMHHLSALLGISEQDYPLTNVPVIISVNFMISRPDSHFIGNNRENGIRPGFDHAVPTAQGDIDNFEKFFLDAISGIFYNDDSYVVGMKSSKLFTTNPIGRYVFTVRRRRRAEIVNLVDIVNIDEN
jgi:Holliday junction resolvase RusA-like endonuclease